MTNVAEAPYPTYRLIPSQFPPIGLFDTVATPADLSAVMDLVGWTNNRLVTSRIARLPQQEWVYGRPNASIVMAAFLHVSPAGMRFNSSELGAWYAAGEIETAAAEVGHHLQREAVARSLPELTRVYRSYSARLSGVYLDIRGHQAERADVYAPDRYDASQQFGEAIRLAGEAGIIYDSLRRRGGTNIVAHRPTNIRDVTQADHFEIRVPAVGRRIDVRKLTAP
ncbi:RES family NAD+ phosphorylase [Microvirga sp. VF16]|uniref:RES family NAD+ phosphorylase n=1 Tax=Microvirga sp. VF16 TaxID=2807101 RepID=UPI00193E2ACB|nr:RES family NAD+ phosphorylase [Microvirga sp. VF16]QRM32731.1 RES family NAD+ phosphorylase [Microvirga sp. VF16]